MTDDICDRCGKHVYRTYRAALRGAVGMMRERKRYRGMRPYRSRACDCYHVGMATSKKRKRMTTDHARKRSTLRREMYA